MASPASRPGFGAARSWTALLSMLLALSLSPRAVGAKSAADYYVRNLPGLPHDAPPIKMHAGHIEISPEHHGNMFFWHFQNKHIANRQRTVIWVNGGPGCSSEDGALMEVGPYRVQDQHHLVLNNGSWNEFANLLFVDNPVGTGFSFVDTDSMVQELDAMAEQFVHFLEEFFAIFPEYDRDHIYIAGESFAGQYIPYIAKAILDRNKRKIGSEWALRGLLIGNGWVSPKEQYPAYLNFARQKNLVEKDSEVDQQLQAKQRVCDRMMASNPGHVNYEECEEVLQSLLRKVKTGSGDNACFNMYDVRLRDSFPSCGMNWPPDLKGLTPYLRRQAVINALHVSNQRNTGWQECNGAVGSVFQSKKSRPAGELLPEVISQVPVLLFSGAEDLICNHMGTELMVENLEWSGGKGFEVTPGNWAPRRTWTFEGEVAGFWQEARNLTYVLFYNASHMVPFDYPRRSRDMLDRFMGVDISNIGGEPTDSRIDGEKGRETTVGCVSNHTKAEEEALKKINEAKWAAYRRSGETVLIIVIIAATAWAYFIWRERRKGARYRALRGVTEAGPGGMRSAVLGDAPSSDDLEAAAAFDETSLDELPPMGSSAAGGARYSIGEDSDGEELEDLKPRSEEAQKDGGERQE